VLIDAVGLPNIQATQRALGLETTALNRRFLGRLPNPGDPDNVACAVDLTHVLAAIATGEAASRERCDWMLGLLADQQHRDRIARCLPVNVSYAGKTGSLTGLTHDCGIIAGPGGSAALAVLTQGFDDSYAADAFIGRVAEAAARDLGLQNPGFRGQ
jgi:beta-lactamase class A